MQIQIRTDNHIHVHESRATELEAIVTHALRHCSQHITRIELHLSDNIGTKPGQQDKCCVMEARLEGRQPMAVTEHSETVGGSVTGAADKLARMVKSTLDRAADRRPAAPPEQLEPDESEPEEIDSELIDSEDIDLEQAESR